MTSSEETPKSTTPAAKEPTQDTPRGRKGFAPVWAGVLSIIFGVSLFIWLRGIDISNFPSNLPSFWDSFFEFIQKWPDHPMKNIVYGQMYPPFSLAAQNRTIAGALSLCFGLLGFFIFHFNILLKIQPERRGWMMRVHILVPLLGMVFMLLLTGLGSFPALIAPILLIPLSIPSWPGYRHPPSAGALFVFYAALCIDILLKGMLLGAVYLFYIIWICGQGYVFNGFYPAYRRYRGLWWPADLPRLGRQKKGTTLIELLIAIAILAILLASSTQAIATSHRLARMNEEKQMAIELAESQIALIKGRDVLPEPGVYPMDGELGALFESAEFGQYEVAAGPAASLREIRVLIALPDELGGLRLQLRAIVRGEPQ